MAVAREAADAQAIPAHHQPIAVMFELVDPERAGRWPGHLRRLARFDDAGGTPLDHGTEDRAVAGRFNRAQRAVGSLVRPFIQIDVVNRALYQFAQRDQRVARPER
jgi:hypothetical protein